MLVLLIGLIGFSIFHALNDNPFPLYAVLGALLFSVTILIVLHEFIHALAYWSNGARQLKAGMIWRKFIFYVAAHRQVVDYRTFRIVALAPLVSIKVLCLLGICFAGNVPLSYFFASIMFLHSLFCGGDIAMLSFYEKYRDKTIYTYDDLDQEKTFFYFVRRIRE